MSLGGFSDHLPAYPNNIQGELRLILQTKDIFLVCYKHLEEYRKLVNEQNRLITKEFVQEQLQIGEDEIAELRMELQDADARLSVRLKHNELLADHLASLGYGSLESGGSVRHLALCRSPQSRKTMMAQRQTAVNESRPATHMIDNIALAISEIHQEVRSKVKPLLDYYRDLFYLQLHFSLVLGQVCNYCMPLVTENISLIDRVFFWSERPEFDLIRRAGDISDRLKEIYTRAQTILSVLGESVRFLQSKVELQKQLEQRFHERLDEQQKTKDKILREVHSAKQSMDTLEEENDRLVGSLVKIDPAFVDSRHFVELAEGGANLSSKKSQPPPKDFGQHNFAEKSSVPSDTLYKNANKHATEASSSGSLDVNNNKAASVAGDDPKTMLNSIDNLKSPTQVTKKELSALLEDLKYKLNQSETPALQRDAEAEDIQSPSWHSSRSTTPTPKRKKHAAASKTRHKHRSKSHHSESQTDELGKRSHKKSSHIRERRSVSMERKKENKKTKKIRSKSTLGVRPLVDEQKTDHDRLSKRRSSRRRRVSMSSALSNLSDDARRSISPKAPQSLKSKLLGRTKEILDAALRRPAKASSSDHLSYKDSVQLSSLTTSERVNGVFDVNNDGGTSVSSFASLELSDSPTPNINLANESQLLHKIPAQNLRTLEPKHKQVKKSRRAKTSKAHRSPSTPLGSEGLELETERARRMTRSSSKPKNSSKNRLSREVESNLGEFLAGSSTDDVDQLSPSSSLPQLL